MKTSSVLLLIYITNKTDIESVAWVQIIDDAVCVSVRAKALEKNMIPSLVSPAMGK